jgi:c-di-GMP-binding flagellar brake protein YcgR
MDERKEILRSSHTVDLSRTGVGFISTRFVPINSKLMVELSLSRSENPVLVQGSVKWVEKVPNSQNFRIGMNFSDISTDTQSRIEKHFKS